MHSTGANGQNADAESPFVRAAPGLDSAPRRIRDRATAWAWRLSLAACRRALTASARRVRLGPAAGIARPRWRPAPARCCAGGPGGPGGAAGRPGRRHRDGAKLPARECQRPVGFGSPIEFRLGCRRSDHDHDPTPSRTGRRIETRDMTRMPGSRLGFRVRTDSESTRDSGLTR